MSDVFQILQTKHVVLYLDRQVAPAKGPVQSGFDKAVCYKTCRKRVSTVVGMGSISADSIKFFLFKII